MPESLATLIKAKADYQSHNISVIQLIEAVNRDAGATGDRIITVEQAIEYIDNQMDGYFYNLETD